MSGYVCLLGLVSRELILYRDGMVVDLMVALIARRSLI